MLEKVNVLRDKVFRRYMAHEFAMSMQLETERDKIICCDFIVEADTSPQDEFELFKYIYSQKERQFTPYYIINENCAAYPEIKEKYGENIIAYSPEKLKSFALKMNEIFKTVKFICGGFQVLHSLRLGITEAVKRSPYVYSIFTQHGITFFKDDFISQASYSKFLFDKLMISNDFEKEIFMKRACYKEEDLIKNGLFRWDLLSSEKSGTEKSIFIYFTHRRYLKNIPEEELKDTVYVKTIVGLLEDPRFQKFVKENGYTLKVALHHSVLQVCGNDLLEGVKILEDDEIAGAKKDSAILITDYSSMCFEMWFQHKPSIFLNIPDSEDCRKYHHKTDLADPYSSKMDVIFNVVDTVDECVDRLEEYHRTGFALTAEEKVKRDRFFYYNGGFCERFYHLLVSMKHDKKTLYHIPVNATFDFSRDTEIETYGIELASPKGRWIVRKKAYFSFFIPKTENGLALQIYFEPYFYYKQYRILAKVSVNGHHMVSREIFRKKNRDYIILDIPQNYIGSDGKVQIRFQLSHVYRRCQLRASASDRRILSFRLREMDIYERDPAYETAAQQLEMLRVERRRCKFSTEMEEEPAVLTIDPKAITMDSVTPAKRSTAIKITVDPPTLT